jgi:hypothetical protein
MIKMCNGRLAGFKDESCEDVVTYYIVVKRPRVRRTPSCSYCTLLTFNVDFQSISMLSLTLAHIGGASSNGAELRVMFQTQSATCQV